MFSGCWGLCGSCTGRSRGEEWRGGGGGKAFPLLDLETVHVPQSRN